MYCSKCGSNLADDATFCSRCGAQTGVSPSLVTAGAPAPIIAEIPNAIGYGVAPQVYVQPVARVAYAGFWLRVLAYLIDMIVLGLFSVPILIGGAMALGVGSIIEAAVHNQDPFVNGPPPAFAATPRAGASRLLPRGCLA